MKKVSYIFSLILLLIPVYGNAENKDLLKADYLYRQFAFHDAIPYYEKVVAESAGQHARVYARLGDCYRLTKDPAQAVRWYAMAVQSTDVPEDTKLHYGEMLMMLQQYEEAARMLRQYQAAKPGDRRAANLIRGCEIAAELLQQIPEGKATLLPFNTDGSDFGPALRQNDLVFTTDSVLGIGGKKDNWTGNPFYNIYMVSCNNKGQCGNDPEPVGGKMNTKYHDGPAAFTAGGNRMFFTRTTQAKQFFSQQPVSDRTGTVRLQIMIAEEYDTAGKKYNKITPFRYNDKDYSTAHPAVSPDGSMLVFSSDMPGGAGQTDLYLSRREGDGWTQPVNLGPTVNTEGAEMFPVFIDNTTLSFSSNGHAGLGGLDVYYTRRDEAAGTWSEPVNAGIPVNSSYDDMSLTLYSGRHDGYFASNRPAAKKGDNIYHFIRQEVYLNLQVLDSVSGRGIGQAAVLLKSDAGQRRETSGGDGRLITRLFPQALYEVAVSKEGYRAATIRLSAQQPDRERDTINAVVRLLPDLNIIYTAVVVDETSRQPVPQPLVVMTRDGWGKADSALLETGAVYERALEAGYTYHVYAVKENYYGNEKVIPAKGIKPGGAPVRINDTIFMKRLSVGEVYRVDNIYYDFNKADIREDARPALNRLVELLNRYPAMSIQVNAHTDCRGKDAYNLRLSQARAASVIKYLQQHGIDRNRLRSQGFGETNPIHPCRNCDVCTEEQHQMNRRTEFRITAM